MLNEYVLLASTILMHPLEFIPFWILLIELAPIIAEEDDGKYPKQHTPEGSPLRNMIQECHIIHPSILDEWMHLEVEGQHLQWGQSILFRIHTHI